MASMIASPSARAVASTAAAMIAGRAEVVDAERGGALLPRPRHLTQRLGDERHHDGDDHEGEDQHADEPALARQRDHAGDRLLALLRDEVRDERDDDEDPDQAVDD